MTQDPNRPRALRFLRIMPRPRLVAALLALLALAAGPALAAPALVMDIDSGRVLYAKEAREPWYPASVTKVMTAYLVMHALRNGQLKPDTPLVVSARAAAAPPSKMGFRPGVEVTVDNALKMMMVKSANDMAIVLAEGVGGTVENFVRMMNDAAHELGMVQTSFANPNGLPDPDNRSTARDLALLARTALLQFPEYAHYFGIEAVQLGKRIYKNTNGLVGRYPYVTGMKTGFICSSGFNVVATATRGNRRLLAVVLGAPSGAARTLMAAALLDRGFADSGWGGPGNLDTLPLPTRLDPPDLREKVCGAGRGARGEEEAENGAGAPSPVFALFGGGNSDWETPVAGSTLPPRAPLHPIPVFVGRTPDAGATAVARRRAPGGTAAAYAAEDDGPASVKAVKNVRGPSAAARKAATAGAPARSAGAPQKAKGARAPAGRDAAAAHGAPAGAAKGAAKTGGRPEGKDAGKKDAGAKGRTGAKAGDAARKDARAGQGAATGTR